MTQKLELRRLARDSVYNLIRFGWGLIIGMFISIILARGLGKEARGIYTLTVLLPELLVVVLNLGIAPATVFFIGRGDYDPEEVVRKNIGLAFWVSIASIVAGSVLILLAGNWLFPNVPRHYLLLGLLIIPINLMTTYLISILQGLQDFRLYNLIGIISQMLLLVFAITFVWWLRKGVLGALLALLGGNFGGLLFLITILKGKTPLAQLIDLRFDLDYTREVLRYGVKAQMSNFVTFLNYRADTFILNYLVGPSQVGIYSISVGLAERMWIPSNAIATVILPRIASLKDDEETRKKITPMTARYVLWLSLVMAVFTWLLANWVIVFLYAEEYHPSALALRLLLPGVVVFNLTRILANDIAGRGKPEINFYQSLAALVVNILANLILIPIWGAAGASTSSTISYSTLAILTLIAYCKITGLPWKEMVFLNQLDLVRIVKTVRLYLSRLTNRQKRTPFQSS
jgi:O-antigen/teichoic acid export membrane protein